MQIPLNNLFQPHDPELARFRPSFSPFDFVPLVVMVLFAGFYIGLVFLRVPSGDLALLALAYSFFSPLATGIWALFCMMFPVRHLCQLNCREEFSLTQLDPAEWIRVKIRDRLRVLLAVPALNMFVIFPLGLALSLRLAVIDRDPVPILAYLSASYFFGAMQICAITVTLAGVFDMIHLFCQPSGENHRAMLAPAKWSLALIITPILVIIAGAVTVGIVAVVAPIVLCIYLPKEAANYWQKAVASYFDFP